MHNHYSAHFIKKKLKITKSIQQLNLTWVRRVVSLHHVSFNYFLPLLELFFSLNFYLFFLLFFHKKKKKKEFEWEKNTLNIKVKTQCFFSVHYFRYRLFSIFVSSYYFFFFTAKNFPPYLPQTPSEKLNGTFLPAHTVTVSFLFAKEIPVLLDYPLLVGNTARKFELSSKEWESVTKHLRDAGGRLKWIMLLLGTVICKCPSLSRALKVYLINFVISLHVITKRKQGAGNEDMIFSILHGAY